MNPRALMLVAALLAPSAWAQEPAANTPAVTPRSFDLGNESIKKIVRDFVATQSVSVQLAAEPPAKQERLAKVEYEPPESAPLKQPAPRRAAPKAPEPDGFFSTLVGALVETGIDALLDVDDETYSCVSHEGFCISTDTPKYPPPR